MRVAFEDIEEFLEALILARHKRTTLDRLQFTLKLVSQLWSCLSPADSLEFRWKWQPATPELLIKRQDQAAPTNLEELDSKAMGDER